ncbi:MAG TPA: dockerin type I domain-containing protein, partial [Phaeodactylibacter sp.]|nr:dockerin type I domain-containing protein [Phaeodactylibacter sp.]
WREFDVDSTDGTGEYSFFEQAYSVDSAYIKPIREGDELNGVSTLDLVLISKHILGVQPFDSYTQYIAADINRSGSITLMDLIQLRRLILQQEGFDNNTSWRFIPEDQDHWGAGSLTDWNNISEQIHLYDVEAYIEGLPVYTVDFLAIKIGDLDGSATP